MPDAPGAHDATHVPNSRPSLRGGRLDPGARVGNRYDIVKWLAQGGMGAVYLAMDTAVSRTVALKIIPRQVGDDPMVRARFLREVKAAAALSHPNIVRLFDVGEEEEFWYYTMEFVNGPSLSQLLKETRRLLPRTAMRLGAQVARALAHAHAAGIVHRDIKPGNVLVIAESPPLKTSTTLTSLRVADGFVEEYRAMLLDFGLARDANDATALTLTGDVLGTPLYMSPEQTAGAKDIDARTDVWSLGTVLYEVVTGVAPFVGESVMEILHKVKSVDPVPPSRLAPDMSRDAETIVLKALEKNPARRYQSAREFADDLERFLRGEAIHARPPSWVYRSMKAAAKRPALSGALGALFLAVAGLSAGLGGPAWVAVKATPPGARVYIDDELRGTAPGTFRVWPATSVRVDVLAEGHEPQKASASVKPWRTIELDPIALRHDSGMLRLDIEPASARVVLSQGDVTVRELEGGRSEVALRNGVYKMTVSAPDYHSHETAFSITPADDAVPGAIRLEHEFGFLEVDADGPGTTLRAYPDTGTPDPSPKTCRLGDIPPAQPAAQAALPVRSLRLDTGTWRLYFTRRSSFPRSCVVRVEAGKTVRLRSWLEEMTRWWVPVNRPIHGGPQAADLYGNGSLEIVFAATDWRVYSLRGMDAIRTWAFESGGANESSVEMGDVDGDGTADCVFCSEDGHVRALGGRNGRPLWDRGFLSAARGIPRVADLDRDGTNEVVFEADGILVCAEGATGNSRWVFPAPGGAEGRCAVAAIDGDDVLDVIVATRNNLVAAVSGKDGHPLWTFVAGGPVYGSPAAADVDGDGIDDIAVASDRLIVLSGRDGHKLWDYPCGSSPASPAFARLDGDPAPDLVVPGGDAAIHALSGRNGSLLWRTPLPGRSRCLPAIADVDSDGTPDAVVSCSDGAIHFLSGRDGKSLWAFETNGPTQSSPLLVDVGGNGSLECAAGSDDGRIWLFAAQPGPARWRFPSTAGGVCSPVLLDADKDGTRDAVLAGPEGIIRMLSAADGRVLWEADATGGIAGTTRLPDVDGDGVPEVLAGLWQPDEHGACIAYSGATGVVLWRASESGPVGSPAATGDIDGDGKADVALGVGPGGNAVVTYGSASGRELRRFSCKVHFLQGLTSGDLDGDGLPELFAGANDNRLRIIGSDGRERFQVDTLHAIESPAAIADLDGDGATDIVFTCLDKRARAVSGKDGRVLWRYDIGAESESGPVIGDLDGDGAPEVVFGANNSSIHAVGGRDGLRRWRFNAGDQVRDTIVVADLDGDRKAEVLAGAWDSRVYVLEGSDGRPRFELDTGREAVNRRPVLEDTDGDGIPETLYLASHRNLARMDIPRRSPIERPDARTARRWARREIWPALAARGDAADPQQGISLAKAFLALGDPARAAAAASNTAAHFPRDPHCRVLLAAAKNDPVALGEALALDPFATFDFALRNGLLDEIASCASSLEPPARPLARAAALLLARRFDEARAALDQLIAGGRRPDLLLLRGHAALLAGDPEAALADWEALERVGGMGSDMRGYVARARSLTADPRKNAIEHARARRWEEAWTWYDRALAKFPDDAATLNEFAWFVATHAWRNDRQPEAPAPTELTAKAVAAAKRALELGPAAQRWEFLDTLGAASWANGEKEAALKAGEEAVSLAPEARKGELARRVGVYRDGVK
ncbi:MAG: FG-GAP-like repeat-containing protein [Planctomycetota bacterium]